MKHFTIDEANELLPTVRELLYRIKMLYGYASQFKQEAKIAASVSQFGGGMPGGSKYVNSLSEIGKLTMQLDDLGVQLKDYERGLIDFPFKRNGRTALLCWQFDDGDEIRWWHEIEAGFAGRQPL